MRCPRCGLAQLSVVVRPDILYKNYPYVTGKSATMKTHFASLLEAIKEESPIESVMEVGSNDGDFLAFCRDNGTDNVVGIDAAENLCKVANERGIQTVCGLFDKETVEIASAAMPKPDVIVARHVFCHVDSWWGFVEALEKASAKETLVVIEVPYVKDLLERGEFDTCYHEHLSYLSLRALKWLLDTGVFHLHRIVRFPIHGGALAIMLRRNISDVIPDKSVAEYLSNENITEQTWLDFAARVKLQTNELTYTVRRLVESGKTVCGLGASAKSTVWRSACGFTRADLKFICDSTPQKQWKFSPGTDIPIVDEQALIREQPDYAVLFAWNWKADVLASQRQFLSNGGKFIIPIPTLEIVGK